MTVNLTTRVLKVGPQGFLLTLSIYFMTRDKGRFEKIGRYQPIMKDTNKMMSEADGTSEAGGMTVKFTTRDVEKARQGIKKGPHPLL